MQPSVSVVHLIWMPYGIRFFREFVDSYLSFNAGHPHQLVLLFNGITDEKDTLAYHQYIESFGITYETYYYKTGMDLEAYRWVASQLSSAYILFLNSYSRFLAKNWLQKFVKCLTGNTALIGATGSWQSYYSAVFKIHHWAWTKGFTIEQNIVKYKLLLKATILWRLYFKPFPNPHIRTNAFIINRELFLGLRCKRTIRKKIDAYRLESGRNSITNQVIKKGFEVSIVDINGNSYLIRNWDVSNIFWLHDQENLLIADNQTEAYFRADIKNKKSMENLAWGVNHLPY